MQLEEAFTTYSPIQDYVAIKRVPPETMSRGGIHIPATVAENYRAHEGIVVGVGPGRFDGEGKRLAPPECKKGDHVFFGRYAGAESSLDHPDFWMVRWELIDAVLEP